MRHLNRRLIRLLALLLGLVPLLAGHPVSATDPDFSSVSDILGGRRYLMRIDDVAVVSVDQAVVTTLIAETSNSAVTSTTFEGAFGISNTDPLFSSPVSQATDVAPLALGRMVNLPRDVFVSLLLGTDGQWHFFVTDAQTNTGVNAIVPTDLEPVFGGRSSQAVVLADFDGDGYVEALIAYFGQSGPGIVLQGAMRIVRPVDVNDLTKGVSFGPEVFTTAAIGLPFSTLKTGDVNGDGRLEILSFNGTSLSVSLVDPTTFDIAPAVASVTLPNNAVVFPFNLMAGRFRDTPFDDVVVVGQLNGGPNGVTLYAISGNSDLDLTLAGTTFVGTGPEPVLHVYLAKGPLTDWFAGQDLLVVGTATVIEGLVTIHSSDQTLALSQVSSTLVTTASNAIGGCLYGLAVGNFDNRQSDGQHNPSLQIATFWRSVGILPLSLCNELGGGGLNNPAIRLWSVTPPVPPAQSSNWLNLLQDVEPFGHARPSGLLMAVGDAQGRSLVLGAPQKVTILGDIHPDIVLGIPPMHIDWVNPLIPLNPAAYPGCSDRSDRLVPCPLNLTVLPSVPAPGIGFSTQYSFTSSAATQASRKSTTSWSLGVTLTQESKTTIGVPDVDAVSVDIKQSAGFTHDGTVATAHNTYTGLTENLTATTGFADHLFFTQRRQNIYYYPVIGQTACPAANPTCSPDQRQPLVVSFSGPDEILHSDIDASLQEWYQPVHEPGNVLSYPWNLTQLQQGFGSLSPLTTNPAPWQATDTSQTAYSTTWAGTSQQSNSTGSVNAESYSLSITVSGTATLEEGQEQASAGFELNQSASVSTLNALTQTLSASTGIQVNKPPFPSLIADNYLYDFGGYVFGLNNPNATLQTIKLSDQSGPIGIQSTGPLIVGFVADPLREGLPWWRQAYSLPDVGLNHPERWDWTRSTQTATFNPPDPTLPPQDQSFYRMKGFFIAPAGAGGLGPNRTTATAGDQLELTARVYNFSLIDTNDPGLAVPAASIHVRFYGQEYDFSTGMLKGPGFLIGESQIGFITGFNSPSTGPGGANWTVTSVPFDTTPYPDTHLVFWVVVWMEDGQGNLVPEMPDHGLAGNPAQLPPFDQLTDVPVQTHSNNVGLYGYNTPFYVASAAANLDAGAPGQLTVSGVAAGTPTRLDGRTRVSAEIRAVGGSRDAVPVAFYDGDPQRGGKLFDFQHIPHLRADQPHQVRAFFRPDTCGPHSIAVVAGTPASGSAAGHTTIDVDIRPVDVVDGLISAVHRFDLPRSIGLGLLRKLDVARAMFQSAQTAQGRRQMAAFEQDVAARRGKGLTIHQADSLLGQARLFKSCPFDSELTPTVIALTGGASRVGDATPGGQVRLSGRFTLPAAARDLDLGTAHVTIANLLTETGGAGELVDRVAAGPVDLAPRRGGRPTSAIFESQPPSGPAFRMQIRQRTDGTADFSLTADRATLSRDPQGCSAATSPSTELSTRFVIDDGQHAPVTVEARRAWMCVGPAPETGRELSLR